MKVIPITRLENSAAESCGEDSGDVPKMNLPLTDLVNEEWPDPRKGELFKIVSILTRSNSAPNE